MNTKIESGERAPSEAEHPGYKKLYETAMMLLDMRDRNDKRLDALASPALQAEPGQWIDDPHDIEQGQMLDPEWLRWHSLTAKEGSRIYAPPALQAEPVKDDAKHIRGKEQAEQADRESAAMAAAPGKPQSPALQAAPQGEPTDAMVQAYLDAQRAAVEEADRFGRPNVGGLHTNTVREACRAGLRAALGVASPALQAEPHPSGQSEEFIKGWNSHRRDMEELGQSARPALHAAPTDEQIDGVASTVWEDFEDDIDRRREFARAILAAQGKPQGAQS